MRTLRDYQREAITYLKEAWAAGFTRPPAVLATGLGKTEIFTDPTLLADFLERGERVLIIAHTDELIEQAARKARRNNPGVRVGIVKAGLNQVSAQIIVSSRQTLAGARRRNQLHRVGLIIVDEAHHAVRTNTYGKILEHFGAFDELCSECVDANEQVSGEMGYAVTATYCPNDGCATMAPKVAGFTATLARGDKQKLSTVWQAPDDRPFVRDVLFGIRRGYLLDVVGQRVVVPDFDMSKVRQSGGDFRDGDLADEMERTFAPEIVAEAYAEHSGGRKGIAFWPLVSTAERGAKAFNEAGIRSEVIHGDMRSLPRRERRALLQRLASGETRVVHGVSVLTEGFDDPTVDVCIVARPTRSAPLYQQMVGRVLRPDLTKPVAERGKALVLDVVGAGATHDLRSLVDLAPQRAIPPMVADEDRSLLTMDDDWEELRKREGNAPDFTEVYAGETAVVAFDPLGRANLWTKTPEGAWFIPAGTVGYAFLTETVEGDPGHFDVVLCSPSSGAGSWIKPTEYTDLPLEEALGWAEELAVEVGGYGTKSLIGKKSKWRGDEPSVAQQNWARREGLNIEGMTKGEVSDLRNYAEAIARVDPLVRDVRAMIESEAGQ